MGSRSKRNVWLVMKREFATTVSRRSFWLTTFLLPLGILVLSLGSQAVAERSVSETTLPAPGQGTNVPAVGYVDASGILQGLPPDLGSGIVQAYPEEASARDALLSGQVAEYYLISRDYLQAGALTLVTKGRHPVGEANVSPLLAYALSYNLTKSAPAARLLTVPVGALVTTTLAPAATGETSRDSLAFVVPYAALFILYLVLIMTGGFMLTSVAKEKENRTAELLLVSVRPRDLMLGKVVGLAGVGLVQIIIWLGAGLVILSQAEHFTATVSSYHLPAGFVPWTLAYFLLGFLLYASLFAALGVMAHTVREASQLTYVALVPLIIPLLVASTLIEEPHGTLAVVLSLFPLTSPVAMVTRLAATSVPLWQTVLGLVLLAASAYGMVLVAARFFRVENLLSSGAFSWRKLVAELTSRVRPAPR